MTRTVDDQLVIIDRNYFPAYVALAQANIRSIEESAYVRRLLLAIREAPDSAPKLNDLRQRIANAADSVETREIDSVLVVGKIEPQRMFESGKVRSRPSAWLYATLMSRRSTPTGAGIGRRRAPVSRAALPFIRAIRRSLIALLFLRTLFYTMHYPPSAMGPRSHSKVSTSFEISGKRLCRGPRRQLLLLLAGRSVLNLRRNVPARTINGKRCPCMESALS